jgi:Zn-dependent peptidase ImmA (M78 family)
MSFFQYRNEALDAIARKVVSQYNPSLLNTPAPIPVECIMEEVYGLTIEYQYIRKNGRVLGETVFENAMVPIYVRENNEGYKLVPVKAGTVIIDASLIHKRGDGRYRYTLAHELAHWVIDKDYFTQLGEKTAAMTKKAVRSSETDKAVERQADRLACRILMPKGTLKTAFYRAYPGGGNIASILANQFGVSRQAMEIRLDEMGLLPKHTK